MEQALQIPEAIDGQASGMSVSKLTLAEFVDSTPASSMFREMLLASRQFGFTEGGVNQDKFALTLLGTQAASEDRDTRIVALRTAMMNVGPYRDFLTTFNERKVPAPAAFKEFLKTTANVPEVWLEDCMQQLLADAKVAGFLREIKGSLYVTVQGNLISPSMGSNESDELPHDNETQTSERLVDDNEPNHSEPNAAIELPRNPARGDTPQLNAPKTPRKVFVAHGKNHKPLDELRALLTDLGVPFVVVKDEAHAGRPISTKVAQAMNDECSSAICIFSADERFLREADDGNTLEVWRPSENAIYELGAASVLYGRRIILFKEDKVTLPSDFSDIGHITFSSDGLSNRMAELLKELRAHGIIEVVVATS